MLNEDQCWTAVQAKDSRQDGLLIFGVTTTGVFCRPSCPSRLPLRKNVRFYATAVEAQQDGLRPCRRCHPSAARDIQAERIRRLCEYIRNHADEALTLAQLGSVAGLSASHLQQQFKAVLGITPRQYQEAIRMQVLKKEMRAGRPVTEAILEAGFGGVSRVYERSDATIGMTPRQYRHGGENVTISCMSFDSPLGRLMVGATDRGLCFVQFGDSDEALYNALRAEYPYAVLDKMARPESDQFFAWTEALAEHLHGKQPHGDLPLDLRATAFQCKVWRYLQSIPSGEVRSYAEVAAGISQPTASRAVAGACAANRVAILIPCHRVIRGDGGLGGFRWGVDRKQALLTLEREMPKDPASEEPGV